MTKKVKFEDFEDVDRSSFEADGDSRAYENNPSGSDHHRFTILFEENRVNLYDFLIRMCAEQHSVVQIMHEVLETLIRDLPSDVSDREFIVTLFKTTRSFSAHIWKTSTPSLIPPEDVEKGSEEYIVQKEILTLHRREKEVICLRWMLQFSWAEIGEILEYSFDEERITGAELLFEDFCSRTNSEPAHLSRVLPEFSRYSAPEATRFITQAVSKAMSGIVRNREILGKKRLFSYIAIGVLVVLGYYFVAVDSEILVETIEKATLFFRK